MWRCHGPITAGVMEGLQVAITDKQSAEAWLEQQDQKTQVWFATRCALRTAPGLWVEPEGSKGDLILVYFRAVLIGFAGSNCSPADLASLIPAAEAAFAVVKPSTGYSVATNAVAKSAALAAAVVSRDVSSSHWSREVEKNLITAIESATARSVSGHQAVLKGNPVELGRLAVESAGTAETSDIEVPGGGDHFGSTPNCQKVLHSYGPALMRLWPSMMKSLVSGESGTRRS